MSTLETAPTFRTGTWNEYAIQKCCCGTVEMVGLTTDMIEAVTKFRGINLSDAIRDVTYWRVFESVSDPFRRREGGVLL